MITQHILTILIILATLAVFYITGRLFTEEYYYSISDILMNIVVGFVLLMTISAGTILVWYLYDTIYDLVQPLLIKLHL